MNTNRKAQITKRHILVTVVMGILGAGVPRASADIMYSVTDLGTLGGTASAAYDINDSGQITGKATTTGDVAEHAFLWTFGGTAGPLSNPQMKDLGTLGGTNSTGFAINAGGQVTGWADLSSGTAEHAFRYDGGSLIDLGTLPGGTQSRGIGINASGQVTGKSLTTGPAADHAFRTAANASIAAVGNDLGTFGGPTSSGHRISDFGKVVGQATTNCCGLPAYAFLYDAGPMIDLGTLGGADSSAYDINEDGSGNVVGIVGAAAVFGNQRHAFLWTPGGTDGPPSNPQMKDLGTLGGLNSDARGINDSGQIVGFFQHDGGVGTHAFIYNDGVMSDLNDLISPSSGWDELVFAYKINNLGQIVGEGMIDGQMHGFLLTSIPEPSGLGLLGLGALVLRRRRREQ